MNYLHQKKRKKTSRKKNKESGQTAPTEKRDWKPKKGNSCDTPAISHESISSNSNPQSFSSHT